MSIIYLRNLLRVNTHQQAKRQLRPLMLIGWQETSAVACGEVLFHMTSSTRKPLSLLFRAMWHITNQKYGANALGLQRVLNLGSYHTAWQWLHKLRRAMVRPDRDRLSGIVEVDETYVGGKKKPGK